ncbi:MAG: DedA family protein [Chloroflexota bacterium]
MLADLVAALTRLFENAVITLGVPGIMLIAFLENIFPPTPSEFLYPLAGKLAYDGEIHLLTVIIAGAAGSLIGAIIFYHAGLYLGDKRVRALIIRWGEIQLWRLRISLVTIENYERAMNTFERHSGIIVAVARSVPMIHGIISIPAGIAQMHLGKFLFYTFVGSVAWIAPTVLLGYALGSQWEQALHLLDTYEMIWYIIIGLGLAYWIYRKLRQKPEHDTNTAKD